MESEQDAPTQRLVKPRSDRRLLRAFVKDRSASTAIEFGFIGMVLVTAMLAIFQFSLYFLTEMTLHDALSDAATGNTTATYAANKPSLKTQICSRLVLADKCDSNLKLEMAPLATFAGGAVAVSGALFVPAVSGVPSVIRAEAPVLTFVPGISSLVVRGAALFVRP